MIALYNDMVPHIVNYSIDNGIDKGYALLQFSLPRKVLYGIYNHLCRVDEYLMHLEVLPKDEKMFYWKKSAAFSQDKEEREKICKGMYLLKLLTSAQ